MTKNGNFVYTDPTSRTVNILENTQIHEVIRLRGWRPQGVCSTASGDLLVIMHKVDVTLAQLKDNAFNLMKEGILFF